MLRDSPSAAAVLVATLLVAGCAGAGTEGPSDPFEEPVVVEIGRGLTSMEIAEKLEGAGVIASKWGFLWERLWDRSAKLMAGEYEFEGPISAAEAFEKLASGRVILYPLTIPEGLNRFEIAEIVASEGLSTKEEFIALTADPGLAKDILPEAKTLEGLLFPETYNLAKTSTVHDLLDAMLAGFRDALAAASSQRTAEISDWDALVLASMIEKETEKPDERGLVSSVFHNRLQRGMLMQCDPTIIYGLILDGRYRGKIYLSDLSDPHVYNTYIHDGLPPGPIANPGLMSLNAAFAPDESDYLFFCAKPGHGQGHAFSTSLRDHNLAVQALRRHEQSIR
ncbi:MAG: endolytic transglycosylase MltG [Acidobacteriia bacterium]|nr:endolytic transglycosylase MltG [Terriglobia bacterium]MYK11044.1 endolytic transglycosylase MltG [Terriglobia bacterium]